MENNKWLSDGWEYIEDHSPDRVHVFDMVRSQARLLGSAPLPQWYDTGCFYSHYSQERS